MLNVNGKCLVYMSDLKTKPYNIYGNWLSYFSRHVRITSLRARNTLHSCLPLEFIKELTIFHSRLFNISALKWSDIGSKMPDSCCSVGCSNRRGDKPGCFQLIVDVFWFNFSQAGSKVALFLGLAIKAQSPCSGRLIYQNNYLKRE